MKICRNCGKVLEDTAIYCNSCGKAVDLNDYRPEAYSQPKKLSAGEINLLISGILCLISLFIPCFISGEEISLFQISSATSYLDSFSEYMNAEVRVYVFIIRIWPYVGLLAAIGLIASAFIKQGKMPVLCITAFLQTSIAFLLVLIVISEYGIALGTAAYLMLIGNIYGIVACVITELELKRKKIENAFKTYVQENSISGTLAKPAPPERPVSPERSVPLKKPVNEEQKKAVGTISGVSGKNRGKQFFVLPQKTIVIGRDPSIATIVVSVPEISKKHCTISYNHKCYTVRDVSTNGVYLENGERLPANADIALGSGTKLILGHTQEVFRLG